MGKEMSRCGKNIDQISRHANVLNKQGLINESIVSHEEKKVGFSKSLMIIFRNTFFVLAMVFLGSFLADIAGLEAIIRAFLSGLAPLMNRIEFVGNAFYPF